MATYTDPTTLDTTPDAPVTSEFGTAVLENPEAIAEGASGAPRIATKNQFSSAGGSSPTVDFDVASMGGARFAGSARNTANDPIAMKINASDGSFGTEQTFFTASANSEFDFHGYVDFATGSFSVVYRSGTIPTIRTGMLTVTGSLTTLRFTGTNGLSFAIHNMPDGGETTT